MADVKISYKLIVCSFAQVTLRLTLARAGGQMVSENQKESLNSGNQRVLLSCENLANGTYLVRVDLSGRIITKKIIVNH